MKTSSASKFVPLLVVLVTMLAFPHPASAFDDGEFPPVNEAERYILEILPTGQVIDLTSKFPDEAERVVRAEFLEKLIAGELAVQIPRQGIRLNGVVVNEPFNVEFTDVPYEVWLDTSIFRDVVGFYASHFSKDLTFDSARFEKDFDFRLAAVDNSLLMDNSTFNGSAILFRAEIGKDVSIKNAKFTNTDPNTGLVLSGARIGGNVDLSGVTVNGYGNFYQAEIGKDLNLSEAQFTSKDQEAGLIVRNAVIGGTLDASGAAFAVSSSFNRAVVNESFDVRKAQFDNSVSFNGLSVGDLMMCDNAVFNSGVNAVGMKVGGQLQCTASKFNSTNPEDKVEFRNIQTQAAFFEESRFAGDADFSFSTFSDRVRFDYAAFMGRADFSSAHFSGGDVQFDGASFGDPDSVAQFNRIQSEEPISFKNTSFSTGLDLSYSDLKDLIISGESYRPMLTTTLSLKSVVVHREFDLLNVQMANLQAGSLSVSGPAFIQNVKITDRMDIQNASFDSLSIDFATFEWPTAKNSSQVRGITYKDIDIGGQGISEGTWNKLLNVFDDATYSPQAYEALSQFLKDKGKPQAAAEVELHMKKRERNEVLRPGSAAWLWSWFLYYFAGYGHMPYLAFLWSALVVVFGSFVYLRQEDMVATKSDPPRMPYHPLWYSFALFVPYIDLEIASAWTPDPEKRKWAYYYKYIHKLLGWVLMPIALLTFSGIIG